jgi:hypothetical protein
MYRVEKVFKVRRFFLGATDLGLRKKYLKVKKYFVVHIKERVRQTHKFVVRRGKAHGEHMSLPWVQNKAHDKVF